MPLFEYECVPCRSAVEKAVGKIMTDPKRKSAHLVVKSTDTVHSVQIIDLKSGKVEAEAGSPGKNGQDLVRYSENGSKMFLINTVVFRFAELIYQSGDEKKIKCPSCNSKKAEKIVSSFSFTNDLSTDMPKPDLGNLPPEIRSKVKLTGYIEEKDRPKKNR